MMMFSIISTTCSHLSSRSQRLLVSPSSYHKTGQLQRYLSSLQRLSDNQSTNELNLKRQGAHPSYGKAKPFSTRYYYQHAMASDLEFIQQTTKSPASSRQADFSLRDQYYVGAIDQGTTSSRFILFNHRGEIVCSHQLEHRQIYPQAGWCEHDPLEILERVKSCINETFYKMGGVSAERLVAVGITNQRETTVVWDRTTGKPLYNAIVWHDTRTAAIVKRLEGGEGANFLTQGPDRFREATGLPLSVYFSGVKLKWLLENVEGLKAKAEAGDALFGTVDSWLLWNLTGGVNGGVHCTDVSNASRTLLMDISTLSWSREILDSFGIPEKMLPKICSSAEIYGQGSQDSGLYNVKIASMLGDQQAALFGQTCFTPGEGKNTYGTGCFFMLNTGTKPVPSKFGLLTTVGYKIGNLPCVYALEGSIAIAGALIQWLRDNLGIISNASQVEELAKNVTDNGGIYFVPAFAGLFAPRWRRDARGCIVGMTAYTNRHHICRAALEAVCFQSREVVDAMNQDSGVALTTLKVDGGMTSNGTCMQFQADILGVPVVRPKVAETTALGAAYAAGLAVGFWTDGQELLENWKKDSEWTPQMSEADRDKLYEGWNKAVEKSLNWVE